MSCIVVLWVTFTKFYTLIFVVSCSVWFVLVCSSRLTSTKFCWSAPGCTSCQVTRRKHVCTGWSHRFWSVWAVRADRQRYWIDGSRLQCSKGYTLDLVWLSMCVPCCIHKWLNANKGYLCIKIKCWYDIHILSGRLYWRKKTFWKNMFA